MRKGGQVRFAWAAQGNRREPRQRSERTLLPPSPLRRQPGLEPEKDSPRGSFRQREDMEMDDQSQGWKAVRQRPGGARCVPTPAIWIRLVLRPPRACEPDPPAAREGEAPRAHLCAITRAMPLAGRTRPFGAEFVSRRKAQNVPPKCDARPPRFHPPIPGNRAMFSVISVDSCSDHPHDVLNVPQAASSYSCVVAKPASRTRTPQA